MDKLLLKKYAEFAVRSGVNLQKGQNLIINSPIKGDYFARLCAEVAYETGAREVVVHYNDEKFSRLYMEKTDVEVLEQVKPYLLARNMEYYEGEGGACVLHITARDPEIYKGIAAAKVNRATNAVMKTLKPWRDLTMSNKIRWSIVSIPSKPWTAKIFPGVDAAEAEERLWDTIFEVCRIKNGDPVAEWKAHTSQLGVYRDRLNSFNLTSLHLTSAIGTDIEIGLADGCVFVGGGDTAADGVDFLPNIPTEEVFTAPHKDRVNGVVKSSMPYVYNGNLITGITAEFKDGRVVAYSAEQGGDLLAEMLAVDEGAKRLGEIALVPASSPIKKTGLLFYNTLFDENAACHIAFGAAYPDTIKNGTQLNAEQRAEKGLNDSLIHEDIMIGIDDLNITGKTADGSEIAVFTDGVWAKGLLE